MKHTIYYTVILLLFFISSCAPKKPESEANAPAVDTTAEAPMAADGLEKITAAQKARAQKFYQIMREAYPCREKHIPTTCNDADACNTTACLQQLLDRHDIDDTEFEAYLDNYDNSARYQGKVIERNTIENTIQNEYGSCLQSFYLIADATLLPVGGGNYDIQGELNVVLQDEEEDNYNSKYSVAFFKAIIVEKNPAYFEFFKAKRPVTIDGTTKLCNTIIMKVYNTNEEEVYSGDLAGLFP